MPNKIVFLILSGNIRFAQVYLNMVPIWKEAPFVRIVIPFSLGIIVQFNIQWTSIECLVATLAPLISLCIFGFLHITSQYTRYWIYGLCMNSTIFFAAMLLTAFEGNAPITKKDFLTGTVIAKIEEQLTQKEKSYKAIASIQIISSNNSVLTIDGKIIIYFKKAHVEPGLDYGSQIIFTKGLQRITNSGNPGSFDYRRYCAFQQIYFQVFLKHGEYQILPEKKVNDFKQFLFNSRKKIISLLQEFIPGQKEAGLAEALLIGYKDDLDKNLVQSYSDTGVVHIIAISGLHVGLIYWLLNRLFNLISRRKKILLAKSVFVITGLWLFSLIAGGTPSVLRSTVMFSFIVFGESLSRKTSVYNSLAASAFLLLSYNPFWLWDVGFQLSYAAVVSIIVFMKPIYNCCFIESKILDAIWKLNAVTLSAQMLTIPLCLFYFHQFPNYFLLANIIAIPLSSLILLGELVLCALSFSPAIAEAVGWILYWLISFMNAVVERIQHLPYSIFENIHISSVQVVALYITIIGVAAWALRGKRMAIFCAFFGIIIFEIERLNLKLETRKQQKLIVYNITGHHAMDFISGNKYIFTGDTHLLRNRFLANFHLKPSRIRQQVTEISSMPSLFHDDCWFLFNSKKILVLQKPLHIKSLRKRLSLDILILSKNLRMSIFEIHKLLECKQIVFDSSNAPWRIKKWTTECEKLKISCFSVPDKGAFVKTLN